MKIAVIGTGYVGLVTGTCLAEWGNEVVCVDNNPAAISRLKAGEVPIYEPGLGELIAANTMRGRLSFTTEIAMAIPGADLAFIAVGTPPSPADGEADLSFVYEAAREIAHHLTGDIIIVDKSTVPVGTGDAVEKIVGSIRQDVDVAVVSNPEFLREGSAVRDFLEPDRVVLGSENKRAEVVMRRLYTPVSDAGRPVVATSRHTAELIKYASNAFLATKIGLIDEFADLCEAAGADVTELAHAVGLDRRIGKDFLHAGPGFGGSCFPKDTQALLHTAHEFGVQLRIIESTVSGNNARKQRMAHKVLKALDVPAKHARIAVFGLTFKANTDDVRESPAIPLIRTLRRNGASVVAFDPHGAERAREYLPDLEIGIDPYAVARGAHAVVLMTDWDAVRQVDLDRLREVMERPVLVDLQNIYAPAVAAAHGFRWIGVGRTDASALSTAQVETAVPERSMAMAE